MGSKWKIGDKILERYEIVDIMFGGMGVVYQCYDHKVRQTVAAKTFRDDFINSQNMDTIIKQFIMEGKTWISLGWHKNIVSAKFIEIIDGRPYIFLEYVNGGSLRRFLSKNTRIDLIQMLELSIQICSGMDHVSKAGVVHGDLKPENIMLTETFDAKITDFGIARALGKKYLLESTEDDTFSFSGTSYYASPEQFTHFSYTDIASDIYACGVMMYEMFTGKLPFRKRRLVEIMEEKIIERSWPRLKNLNTDVSKKLDQLVLRCLEVAPHNRHGTFMDILSELQLIYYNYTHKRYRLQKNVRTEKAWDLNNRGYSLYNIGYAQEALRCFDEALEIMPEIPEVWLNKSKVLETLGRYKEAEVCLNHAITIDPSIVLKKSQKELVASE